MDYTSEGVLRTKPGRVDSEPTLCMSCSDKIARWNILGLTSGLVVPLLKDPIYLTSVITKELFDSKALSRALVERVKDCECLETVERDTTCRFSFHEIDIWESSEPFDFSKETVTAMAEKEGSSQLPAASASSMLYHSRFSPT